MVATRLSSQLSKAAHFNHAAAKQPSTAQYANDAIPKIPPACIFFAHKQTAESSTNSYPVSHFLFAFSMYTDPATTFMLSFIPLSESLSQRER